MFSSTPFLFAFLPASLVLHFIVTKLFRNHMIAKNLLICLLSSVLYIALSLSSGSFSPIIFLLVAINYLCSYLSRTIEKRVFLVFGILLDIALLIWFKYSANIASALHIELTSNITMPLGISFIIFHCISYLADVSATHTHTHTDCTQVTHISLYSELHELTNCATYILFFPKLFQGPIIRWADFCDSLTNRRITFDCFESGLERFLVGLGKKVLLADEFARILSSFPSVNSMDTPTAWLGMVLFAMRMYFDFSGYSDMAIGLARFFGFELKENFNHPYTSTSITDFWRRWHISLGAWFREYVYFPLGGNRRGNVYINLLAVFILTGLWHGNARIYLYWGLMHGAFILLERTPLYKRLRDRIPGSKYLGWLYTTFVVFIGWLCFRYESGSTVLHYIKTMFGSPPETLSYTWKYFYSKKTLILLGASILGIFLLSRPQFTQLWHRYKNRPSVQITKYLLLLLIFVLCYMGMSYNTYTPFLYFQY